MSIICHSKCHEGETKLPTCPPLWPDWPRTPWAPSSPLTKEHNRSSLSSLLAFATIFKAIGKQKAHLHFHLVCHRSHFFLFPQFLPTEIKSSAVTNGQPSKKRYLRYIFTVDIWLTTLLIPNFRVTLPHRRSATVSLETKSFRSCEKLAELSLYL